MNNFNQNAKSTEINRIPLSGSSQTSISNYNNNIIINNKYESEVSKPVTNLNVIFKFKTILNDELNNKNKEVKIDPKNLINNYNLNDVKKTSNSKEKNSSKKKNDSENLNKKSNNFNSTIKNGNSTSKNKAVNNSKFNVFKNIDSFKYSSNKIKDLLSPKMINSKNISKKKSKDRVTEK